MDRVTVDADALRCVLLALNGPSHHIQELQATRSIHEISPNPIEILITEFNAASRTTTEGAD